MISSNQYLLDTNICIYYLKGMFSLDKKITEIGLGNCFISEITVAEMRFGAENSEKAIENRAIYDAFHQQFQIIPIFGCLDFYAKEKARLRRNGTLIQDFDLLIGATAVMNNLIMVTKNTRDFQRIEGIVLDDWTML